MTDMKDNNLTKICMYSKRDNEGKGILEQIRESKLQSLKEKVENKIEVLERQGTHADVYDYDKDCINAIIAYLKGVLSSITNLEDK